MSGRDCHGSKRGFTLIELSFSIAFISILSITIILIINDTISSYRRGITLNQINTVGMDLVDDMRAAVQNSPASPVISKCEELENSTARTNCQKDGARNFVSVVKLGTVKIGGVSKTNVPIFGAFCTGRYSYIWNSGYFFGDDYTITNISEAATLTYNTGELVSNFKILKVEDDTRAVCFSATVRANASSYNVKRVGNTGYAREISNNFDITGYGIVEEEPIDILSSGEENIGNNLAIYDLTSAAPAESSAGNSLFYSVSFILGTIQGGINVQTSGNFCATPADYELENFDYCAINKFNFAVQATGGLR